MRNDRPIARAYPAKKKSNLWPWLIAGGIMLFGVMGFFVVGFIAVAVEDAAKGKRAASASEFTPDSELIAWKDGDAKDFIGKTFRMKSTYDDLKALRSSRQSAKFRRHADTWGKDVRLEFTVEIPEELDLPNVTYGEDVIIEFVSTLGLRSKGNKVTSLSRWP